MLGICYAYGLGVQANPEYAWKLFNESPSQEYSVIGMGEMYAFGLGIKQNINKGITMMNQYPENPRVKAAMTHFKWGLFGYKQIN